MKKRQNKKNHRKAEVLLRKIFGQKIKEGTELAPKKYNFKFRRNE